MKDFTEITTLGEIISLMDGASGRLIVASMKDPVLAEAREMLLTASLALGEYASERGLD